MFARRFSALRPYIPGEQPKDRPYIKLNANENPYPPSPEVQKAVREFDAGQYRLYPDPDSNALRNAIAGMLGPGVTPDMVFAGNGSDEVLSFIFFTLFDSGAPLHFPEYTYSFYPVYCGYYDIPFRKIPLAPDFSLDCGALLEGESSGLIFANPNAPTGIFLELRDLERLLDKYPSGRPVVVDEAYIDFGGETALPLLEKYKNLVIVRTFSKGFCFAGARLGYAVADPSIIRALFTAKDSFNHFPVDRLTQEIGIAACGDTDYYKKINAEIIQTRASFSEELKKLGWKVFPSRANFVFAGHPSLTGKDVYEYIKKQGVLVRHFDSPGIAGFVRISIGTPDDMQQLLDIIKSL